MFIQQHGKPARTGMNGGARNAGFVQVHKPASNGGYTQVRPNDGGFTQLHPVLPGFQNTRVQGPAVGLHQLVQRVNLASAARQIAGAMTGRHFGPPRPGMGIPARVGGGVRPPIPFPIGRTDVGGGQYIPHPDMAQIGANFAANPTLAPTQGQPIPDAGQGQGDPFTPGGFGTPNTQGIDEFIQQQLLAQRQAMVQRLMRSGQMS